MLCITHSTRIRYPPEGIYTLIAGAGGGASRVTQLSGAPGKITFTPLMRPSADLRSLRQTY